MPASIPRWIEELHAAGRSPADLRMAGWCHGPAGLTHLWATAARVLGGDDHRERCLLAAERAAAPHGSVPTLCCGLAGQAYALLIAHQLTGDVHWLRAGREPGLARGPGGRQPV